MYRFFLYFLSRDNAERAAAKLRVAGYQIWDIQPGWDDPFIRLEARRQLDDDALPGAVASLAQVAQSCDGEYSNHEPCA